MRALSLVSVIVTTQQTRAFTRTSSAVLSSAIQRRTMGASSSSENSYPRTNIVILEIEESRVEKFRQVAEIDAKGSRAEAGCYRFDVLQDKEQANKFVFYEVYKDDDAIAFHKTTSHYKAWADFKKEGGVISQTVLQTDAIEFEP
uniref:ABM domain-containing protein n=1 Tax=Aureoumbra lagunensis TaxID=44058 RepID=A0A7S3NIJ9_9STRA|mmetsp:Transcript_19131/g.24823  ORF Transcript_19131/g.24823 Transcript_19131/m.24823 type:complete len:145 (+) Transcript_19131:30-464(+)